MSRCSIRFIGDPEPEHSMPARIGSGAAIVVLALGLTLSGCTRGSSAAAVRHATYQYSCCRSTDVVAVHRAGEAMTLHWNATAAPAATARTATAVTLTAALTGPFPDAAAVKVAMGSRPNYVHTIVAATVRTTDQTGGTPVSTLSLPTSTPAGFYELTTTVASDGGTVIGNGVVDVGADINTG